jgi:hypothetical protein
VTDKKALLKEVTRNTFHLPMFWFSTVAPPNMLEHALPTDATFPLAMFWLKAAACWTMFTAVKEWTVPLGLGSSWLRASLFKWPLRVYSHSDIKSQSKVKSQLKVQC